MKNLLIEDANELYCWPSKYETYRRNIEKAEDERFCLTEAQFNRLVFMKANDTVWDKNQALVNKLTPAGQPRTLKAVTERIVKEYPHDSPINVFKHLSEDEPWIDGCFIVSARFDHRLLGELKVRPLTHWEKKHSPEGSFYLEDGNHRALVYSVLLRMGVLKRYESVQAIRSLDWAHIYPWAPQVPQNSQ